MSRCFGTSENFSAKDYINKKKNFTLFCDLRKKFITNNYQKTGTNIACLNNNGTIARFQNQSSQLNLRKGYEEFNKKYIKDLSINYTGQLITENNCNYYNFSNNADVSNNYSFSVAVNTLAYAGETGQAAELDSHETIINRYAQIITENGPATGEFENGKKINVTYCALKNSNQIKVVKPGEIP